MGIVLGFILMIVLQYLNKKRIEKIKSELEAVLKKHVNNYQINIVKNQGYEISIVLNDVTYLIKVLKVTSHKEIVITNRSTWIVYENGKLILKNKIKEMETFMNIPFKTNTKKIVLIYPAIFRLLMYINENEMTIVHSDSFVYQHYVISFSEINEHLMHYLK